MDFENAEVGDVLPFQVTNLNLITVNGISVFVASRAHFAEFRAKI